MRVLVTGGAGFIGSHVVDELSGKDPEVVVVVDNLFLGRIENLADASENLGARFKLVKHDCADYPLMKKLIKEHEIDVVFNWAIIPLPTSLERPLWTWEQNIRMTQVFCELAREGELETLIHCSSSEAYGSGVGGPMPETHTLNPKTSYAASKAATDHLVQSYIHTFGIEASIVRPFNNYGPRQNEKTYAAVIPLTIIRVLEGGRPIIHGDGEQTRDFVYVTDTAKAAVSMFESENTRGRIINIGSGREATINEVIEQICKAMDYDGEIEHTDPRPGDVMRHQADIGLARQLIGYEPQISFENGIERTVEWFTKKFEEKD